MFDIENPNWILNNPQIAKEFVKSLSAYELLKIVNKNKDTLTILDQNPIINGIIESNEDGKILLLATCGKIDCFHTEDTELINKLMAKGIAYQCALLSNTRINWYSIFIFDRFSLLDIVIKNILENDSAFTSFCKNPRMDRRLISAIIRGENSRTLPYKTIFTDFTDELRIKASYLALQAVEIKSEHYDGKDSPDNNEQYFNDPNKAFLKLIKEMGNKVEIEDFKSFCENFKYIISNAEFDFEHIDWLTEEEIKAIDSSSDGWREKWHKKSNQCLINIIKFLEQQASNYLAVENDELNKTENYSQVVISSSIISSLIRNYSFRSDFEINIKFLLESKNWTIRSSAYTAIFNNLFISDKNEQLIEFFKFFGHDDAKALTLGILISNKYNLIINSNYEARLIILEYINKLEITKSLLDLYESDFKYISNINPNLDDYTESIRTHNFSTVKNDLFNKRTREITEAANGLKDLVENNEDGKSISYQLGKSIGKIFR